MAAVTVARSVDQAINEGVLIRDVSQEMVLLEPDTSPLYVMTNNAKRKKPSISPRFEWIEDAEVSYWDFGAEGSDKSSSATTLTVNDGTLFATNDLILIPKANSSSAAEEVALVTANSSNILTLTRGVGGSGADTIPATGSIRILGSAFTENSSIPIGRYTSKTTKISYC